ncbi:MAG TPA: transporter [Sutterella sp.]|nr:transporter [Sutterella sp.]
MQSVLPWVGVAVLFLTGWAVIKKYQVNMVLLLGGLALNLLAVLSGVDSILPKNVASTGFVGFDFMELLRAISRTQIAGVGFIILVSGGFAAYMQAIGASERFVTVCAKPLSSIKNPYLILAAVFIFGHCLGLVIVSAAGLAMLMVVTVYPLIIRVGCSSLAAAAVIASVLCIGYAPASGMAVMAAGLVNLDPIEYLVHYQLPMAVPVVLAMAVSHVFVQYYFDRKDNVKGQTLNLKELEEKRQELEKTPAIYALLPIMPIVLLLIFNKMVFKTVTMNVATAMFVAWIVSFILDLVVRRDVRKSFDLSFAMFKGMGNILTSTIGLIFVAAFFATGLQNIGLVTMLINGAKEIGLDVTGTGVLLSAVIGVVTVLTGSGVAAFTSLAYIIPDVAKQLNTDGITIMLMMHTASEMLRAISPVAGVIIIVAGFAKVNPLTMVKRTAIPCLVGYVTMLFVVACFF